MVKWLFDHAQELQIDPAAIAIGGHSAGGNLATGVCLLAKDRHEFPIIFQVLDHPPLDIGRDPASKTCYPAGSPIIPVALARMFDECYLRSPEDARNPLVSPVYAPDLLICRRPW